jgi:hypothetical protein
MRPAREVVGGRFQRIERDGYRVVVPAERLAAALHGLELRMEWAEILKHSHRSVTIAQACVTDPHHDPNESRTRPQRKAPEACATGGLSGGPPFLEGGKSGGLVSFAA